nr:nucleoside diphosphate-linked moiety X motif 17 isoform X1 [Chrysemys picta bellii]
MGARSLGQGLAVCSVSVQRLAPWGPGPGQGSPGRRVSTASTWQYPQLLGTRGSAPARGRAAGNRGGGIPACPAAAEPVARRAASRGAPLRGLQPPRLPGFLRSPQAPSRAHGEPGAGAGAAGQGQRPARARRVPAEHHRALLCVPRGRGDGQLRLGPKPVCHFRQRVPWLHSDPSKETVLLSHQAPGGEAGCRAARGAPRPRGGRGGGRHPAVHRQESLAHAKGQESQHLPQHLGAPRWAHGAGRTGTSSTRPADSIGLLEAGLRELQEETGLRLEPGGFSWRMLGLWESVYPPMLSRGLPRRHHVVAYLLLLSTESHQQLQTRIKADESEVSAYAWLELHVLECIAAVEDGAENTGHVPNNLPPTIKATELSGGSARPTELPTATFLNTAPAAGEDVERVSTGTRFALQLWLDTLAVRDK